MIAKIRDLVKHYQHGLFIGFSMLLVTGIGYNIGRIYAYRNPAAATNQEATIYTNAENIRTTMRPTALPKDPRVVASKAAGSKLYHRPWCSGAQRIKEANKLWFPTEADAIAAGYTLAGNCQ